MHRRYPLALLAVALCTAGCDAAADVEVQPLPSLTRSSPEARLGLPEVAGVWRFAGWELAAGDSASLERELPRFGALFVRAQRRDSVGGAYVVGGARAPMAGEVRRDSTVSVVTYLSPQDARYVAGRLEGDTLWVELTSLAEPGSWPAGARVAYVRTDVQQPFVRIHGALPPPPPPDTTATIAAALPPAADSSAAPGAAAAPSRAAPRAGEAPPIATPTAPPARRAEPAPTTTLPPAERPPAAQRRQAPPTESRRADSVTARPQRPRTQSPEPVPQAPVPRVQVPEPDIPLLGVPVQDTARDTTQLRR